MYENVCFHYFLVNSVYLLSHWDFHWGYVKLINQFRRNCLFYNIDFLLPKKCHLLKLLFYVLLKFCCFHYINHAHLFWKYYTIFSVWIPFKIFLRFFFFFFFTKVSAISFWSSRLSGKKKEILCSNWFEKVYNIWKISWHIHHKNIRNVIINKPA